MSAQEGEAKPTCFSLAWSASKIMISMQYVFLCIFIYKYIHMIKIHIVVQSSKSSTTSPPAFLGNLSVRFWALDLSLAKTCADADVKLNRAEAQAPLRRVWQAQDLKPKTEIRDVSNLQCKESDVAHFQCSTVQQTTFWCHLTPIPWWSP